jgi:structure-specific endonuclease subunit SLX1
MPGKVQKSRVYLLTNNHGHTYVGKTVNPAHRLRQHNGEIAGGAKRTRYGRPWRFACIVSGFKTPTDALRFEWMWQHPRVSRKSRDAIRDTNFKGSGRYGVDRKLHELHVILNQVSGFKRLRARVF